MCTLTWISDPRGTRIYFNRDEKRTRVPAFPPSEMICHGVPVLAPRDGQAGGTWLAVNAFGFTVAVLNYYEADGLLAASAYHHRSRGHLVLDLADAPSSSVMRDRMEHMNVDRYRPFILVGIDAEGQGVEARWDGITCLFQPLSALTLPVTTSSFRTSDVLAARKCRFDAMTAHAPIDDETLKRFHQSRDPLGGPFSVTMTRPDAMTVSFSAVDVGTDDIRYYYQPRIVTGDDPDYESGVIATMKRI